MKLKNKVAIVTGSAQGIGKQVAAAFAREGAHVCLADLNGDKIKEVEKEIRSFGSQALAVPADVTEELSFKSMVEEAVKKFGRVDILSNQAGCTGPIAPAQHVEVKDYEYVMAVKAKGTFITNKVVLPYMIEQRSGSVINTSGTAGLRGYPWRVSYCASQWAIIGITKTIALEAGRFGVRVNAIAPGAVEGERMRKIITETAKTKGMSFQEMENIFIDGTAMKAWPQETEMASVAVFLASDDSNAITGQVIVADKGWSTYGGYKYE
jgi:3-oxoacyl-[acyl-carrier protein] reductase